MKTTMRGRLPLWFLLLVSVLILSCVAAVEDGDEVLGGDADDAYDDGDDEFDHLFDGIPIERKLVDEIFPEEVDDDKVNCFIGYRSKRARRFIERFVDRPIDRQNDFAEIGAVAVELKKIDLKTIEKHKGIKYIEINEDVQAFAETVPYGVALTKSVKGIPPSGVGNCRKRNSFKVAIIDSGVYRQASRR